MSKKQFLKNLESYGIGQVIEELADLQTQIIAAVQETGLAGKLKLELAFKRVDFTNIVVGAKITPTIPRVAPNIVTLFVDENNQLHEQDPKQLNFENVHQIDDKKEINQI